MEVVKSVASKLQIKKTNLYSNFTITGWLTGCIAKCNFCKYANHDNIKINASVDQLIKAIREHVEEQLWPKPPDNLHEKYYVYDIGSETDFALIYQFIDYEKLHKFFLENYKVFCVFSTRNSNLLKLFTEMRGNNKLGIPKFRINVAVCLDNKLYEESLDTAEERITKIDELIISGYEADVHITPFMISARKQSSIPILIKYLQEIFYMNEYFW
jgi:DNA repair photolyase